MQDNWQEFDRQMKSVLHDAREKAPRRVWRAVSARLDSAAPAVAWWRWAVPAFVAAAIVAGLFLAGTFEKAVQEPGDISILADNVNPGATTVPAEGRELEGEALSTADLLAAESEAASFIRQSAGYKSSPSIPAHGSGDTGEMPAENLAESIANGSVSVLLADAEVAREATDERNAEDALNAETSGRPEDKTSDAEDNSGIAAQWARIEREEHMRGAGDIRLRGMYAQGSVGGNDSNITYGGNGISRMAPGSGSVNAGISESGPSTYGVPFTAGLGVRVGVNDKLSFGTGLDYSLLTRTFNGSYNGNSADKYEGAISHSLQYIGIPLNAYYNVLNTRDGLMQVYAWGGAEAEYCLSNRYRLLGLNSTLIKDTAGGFQFSAALGMGLEFKLADKLGLYLDPSVRYYFHGGQPKSVRTDKPLMFNFNAGLRFDF
ncbi:MAG: PorT family protein [Bacteroidales bacterium]|nr:PorT family protein [Bacteroidales bacterium]